MDADDHKEDYWQSLAEVVFERVWELAGQRLPATPVVVKAIETRPPTKKKDEVDRHEHE